MKEIQGYKGRYAITSDGRVWSNVRNRFLASQISHLGYPVITLLDGEGNKKTLLIHRLVAQEFIPNPYKYREVNHKDGVKTTNTIENLEWTTRSENMKHAIRTGLKVMKRGNEHPRTRLSERQVEEVRQKIDFKYGTMSRLAREYGVSVSLISLIGRGYRTAI